MIAKRESPTSISYEDYSLPLLPILFLFLFFFFHDFAARLKLLLDIRSASSFIAKREAAALSFFLRTDLRRIFVERSVITPLIAQLRTLPFLRRHGDVQ